jgi:hypothetical protein
MQKATDKFETLVIYRETKTEEDELPLDEEMLVVGLQSLGVSPTKATTNGRKLRVYFIRSEAHEKYTLLQRALAGATTEPLMVDFCKEVLARQGWRQLLSMMRNFTTDFSAN